MARIELGNAREAQIGNSCSFIVAKFYVMCLRFKDINSFSSLGGSVAVAKGLQVKLRNRLSFSKKKGLLGSLIVLQPFAIAESPGKGLGAFATQKLGRGDLVHSENPLFSTTSSIGFLDPTQIVNAFQSLSPEEKRRYLSLKNACDQNGPNAHRSPIFGIYTTNSFSMGDGREAIFIRASRFNHSCLPNARYSFNAATGKIRIYALRDIDVGEEILVSYIAGRGVYGSNRDNRQKRLTGLGFTCVCSVCTLPQTEIEKSDKRRREINALWISVPNFTPLESSRRILASVRALRLMREEGYCADADDFTNDAAWTCAFHSDWKSAKYWATKTYETRVAEFGADSPRVEEVKKTYLDPKEFRLAGTGPPKVFVERI
jgi:hypothetical protein